MLRKIGKVFMRNLVHVTNFFYLLVGIVIYLVYKHDVGKEFIFFFVRYYCIFLSLTLLFKVYNKITDKVKEKRRKRNEKAEYLEREKRYAKIFPEQAKYHEFLKQRLLAQGLDYTQYIKVPSWLVVFNSFICRTEYMYDKDNFSDINIAAAIMYCNVSKYSTTEEILTIFNAIKELLYLPKLYNINFKADRMQLIETDNVVGKSNPDLMLEYLGEEKFAERVRNNCRLYCMDGNTDNMYKMFNDIYSFGKIA